MLAGQPLPDPQAATTPDGGVAAACKSGGAQIDVGLYACVGTFGAGQAPSLCGAGYHVCASWSSTKDPNAACKTGFFAADVPLTLDFNHDGNVDCEHCTSTSGASVALLGCGNPATKALPSTCNGLKVQVPCDGLFDGWRCKSGLKDAVNSDPASGVLCCVG